MNVMNKIQLMLLGFVLLILASCNSKPERPNPILSADRIAASNAVETQNAATLASSAIQHYYCANNCEGSGGDAAGTCPVCGLEYTHNQAWHNQQNSVSTTTTTTTPGEQGPAIGITPPAQGTPPSQATPEPPQNAAGVWHYICSNGHAGGAGSATTCSECGSTLVHNTAYHN